MSHKSTLFTSNVYHKETNKQQLIYHHHNYTILQKSDYTGFQSVSKIYLKFWYQVYPLGKPDNCFWVHWYSMKAHAEFLLLLLCYYDNYYHYHGNS